MAPMCGGCRVASSRASRAKRARRSWSAVKCDGGRLDRAGGVAGLKRIEQQFGLALDPDRHGRALSVGEQQRLEILKALFRGARMLILDEPTAVLTPAEVDGLFAALRAVAAQGLAIIFISHKLNEVLRAHRPLRGAARTAASLAESRDPAATSAAEMARLMCGHEIVPRRRDAARAGRDACWCSTASRRRRHRRHAAAGASRSRVRGGEIVGIAGVSGNGQRGAGRRHRRHAGAASRQR